MPKTQSRSALPSPPEDGGSMAATSAAASDLDALVRELQHAAGAVTQLQTVE